MEPRPFVFSLERKQLMPPVGPPQPSNRRSAAAAAAAAGTIKGIIEGSDPVVCTHIPSCAPSKKCTGTKPPPKHLQSIEMYKILQPSTLETSASHPENCLAALPSVPCGGGEQQRPPAYAREPSREHTVRVNATVGGNQSCKSPSTGDGDAAEAARLETCPWADPPPKAFAPLTYSRQQYLQSQSSNIFRPAADPVEPPKGKRRYPMPTSPNFIAFCPSPDD